MTCPLCQKPTVEEFTPFCSRGCKSTDLLRWVNGTYRIPTEEPVVDGLVGESGDGEEK